MTDSVITEIARYALAGHDFSAGTLATARLVLADSLGCAALASTHAMRWPATTSPARRSQPPG